MTQPTTDRNMLFGILALQMDFIDREQMVAAMHSWVLDKSKSLGEILVAQGALAPQRLVIIEAVVEEHVKQHSDKPTESLATLGAVGTSVKQQLQELGDAELSVCVSESQASISASLLQRLKSEDKKSWDRLVFLYRPIVIQWCRREGLGDEDADDVAQEVFRGVLTSIAKFRRENQGDTFRGWLWTITRNKIVDQWRRKKVGVDGAGGTNMKHYLDQIPENHDDQSLSTANANEKSGLAQRALALIKVEFRENTWKAFWMTTVENKSPDEVVEALNMKLGAVYTAKSRVLSRLREEFGDLNEDLLG